MNRTGVKADEMCAFLARYCSHLFASGSTCIRLEKNVSRIANAYEMTVEMSILPHHIHLTVRDCDYHEMVTTVTTINDGPISFDINTRLSVLSWDIADRKMSFMEAVREFDRIISCKVTRVFPLPLVVSLANAAFCRLFGGDPIAMAVVFVATFFGFLLKQFLLKRHYDSRVVVLVCSFVSALIASADGLLGLSGTPSVSIGTSVLYLVPGIPYINSFCDFIDSHYICAFGRLMNALMITACLSFGLCAGMLVAHVGMF